MVTLVGNEKLYVQGVSANGMLSGQTFHCFTQDIANLAFTNAPGGTFTLNGTAVITVTNTSIATTDVITYSLGAVGGTVGAYPTIKTISVGSFTISGSAGDTSTYNYNTA